MQWNVLKGRWNKFALQSVEVEKGRVWWGKMQIWRASLKSLLRISWNQTNEWGYHMILRELQQNVRGVTLS